MSSVAVMLHLVGTSLRCFPKAPTDSILLSEFSSMLCEYKFVNASEASASLSSKYFWTLVGIFGVLASVIFLSWAFGPIGAVYWSGVKLSVGFFSSETSMSTGFDDSASSCASVTNLSCILMFACILLLTSAVR